MLSLYSATERVNILLPFHYVILLIISFLYTERDDCNTLYNVYYIYIYERWPQRGQSLNKCWEGISISFPLFNYSTLLHPAAPYRTQLKPTPSYTILFTPLKLHSRKLTTFYSYGPARSKEINVQTTNQLTIFPWWVNCKLWCRYNNI